MPHADFTHLHVHTQFSLLTATCKIPQLIKRAVDLKFPAIAMTDNGNMFGAIRFYQEAMKQGIKPIIGMDAYIAPTSRLDRNAHGIKDASFQLTLLCRNEEGYRNLMKLTTASYLEGFYYKPRMDKEILKKYSAGLIALSGSLKGEVPHYTWNEQLDKARAAIKSYVDIFGAENYYLEIMDRGIDAEKKLMEHYPKFAEEFGVKLVATNDVHYVHQEDAEAHDSLLCIGTGSLVSDEDRLRYFGDNYYLKSADEMKKLFKKFPEAIKNTNEIAERCNVELDLTKMHLPNFKPPKGKKQDEYLKELCMKFLKPKVGGTITKIYDDRLTYELDLIKTMGFAGYFLVVWDFIHYAREHDIPVGPGRGSAAGSLVAFALGITGLDPIEHGLIFERFLNPERVSMPDIDIDFCYERRDEVIEYVRQKYGDESVAHIVTFGTMAARAAIRDVGRVMDMSYADVDRLAKLIPMELDITIEKALKVEPRLKAAVKKDDRVRQLIETSKGLERLCRHASTHAAGVVISDGPLHDYCPVMKSSEQVTTQYDMGSVEKIGLLKMDFLGLRTLTVVDKACKLVEQHRKVKIDFFKLPLTDPKTFEILAKGDAIGVFQLESSGMRDLLKKMRPTCFGDLVALLALYRPGPLGSGMVDDFIKRMHDPSLIKYDHPVLAPILKETYGVILYQEQVMNIVSKMAGFSMAKADSLRRAIGKKIPEIMEREKIAFIKGSAVNKINEELAEKIWNLIEYFSGYGFNKSHSTAYAFISYQTAYLKANYPVEFMAALLTSEKDNTDKIVRYINECKRLKIPVKPPSVNESFSEFACSEDTIHFGLSAIKNVGLGAVESIIESRKKKGKFKSLHDFTERIDLRLCNRKVLESLIKCGAMDDFNLKRSQLFSVLDQALAASARVQHDKARGQLSLLDQMGSEDTMQEAPNMEEWPENELLGYEKEMLGFYVTAHPLAKYEKTLHTHASANSVTLHELNDTASVAIAGIINSIKEITTKRGQRMAFMNLEDLKGHCEVVIFPELFKNAIDLIQKDKCIFIRGKVSLRDDVAKVLADEILTIEEAETIPPRVIAIDLRTAGLELDTLQKLKTVLTEHPGRIPVHLRFLDAHGKRTVISSGDSYMVETEGPLFDQLEELLGDESVKISY